MLPKEPPKSTIWSESFSIESLNAFIKDELKEDDGNFEMNKNIKKDLEELEKRGLVTWDAEPMEKKGGGFPESKKYRDLLHADEESGWFKGKVLWRVDFGKKIWTETKYVKWRV